MTREILIKSALRTLVNEQVKQGSTGYALEEDSAYEVSWKDVLKWLEQHPSEDCISTEMVIDTIKYYWINPQDFNFKDLIADICALPSVQPERPKARLIRKTGRDWNDYYECSNCQACNELVSSLSAQYCFKCGAKIEKRESIEDTVSDSEINQFQF